MNYESVSVNSEERVSKPVLVINVKPVTLFLIISCLALFALSLIFPVLIDWLAFSKDNLFRNPFVLISNALIHNGFTHLMFNMAFLFFLGNALEIHANSKLVMVLFFVSVISSNLSFSLLFPENSSVGISGFIYGLIGSLIIIKPSLKVLMPLGLISIPMPVFIAGPVIGLIEFILSSTIADGVAHVAHFAGFIAGIIIGLGYKIKESIIVI
jgi:membrane associated rhomboid family serine protease